MLSARVGDFHLLVRCDAWGTKERAPFFKRALSVDSSVRRLARHLWPAPRDNLTLKVKLVSYRFFFLAAFFFFISLSVLLWIFGPAYGSSFLLA
jgi:hypothetical protein